MSQQHGNNMYPQTAGNNQAYDSLPCNCNSQPCPAHHHNRMANQPEPITSSGMGITVPFQKSEINQNGYDHVNNPNVMSDPSQGPGGHRFNPDNSGPGFNNNSSSNAGPYGNNNVPYNGQYNGSNVPGNNGHYNNSSNLPGSNDHYNNGSNLPGGNGHYNNGSNLPGGNGYYNNGSNLPGSNGHGSNLPGSNGQYGNGAYNGTGTGNNMTGGDHPYNPHNNVIGADEGTILKERIKGGVEKLSGKITGNAAKVAQGQQRMAAADAAAYHGSRRDDNRMI